MNVIEMYTKNNCPYCSRAKKLLTRKKLVFKEFVIEENDNKTKKEMIKRSGGYTSVPQIFVNDKHIGGYDNLYKIDKNGDLELLLK